MTATTEHTVVESFESPGTVEEAVAAVARLGPGAVLVSGATDIGVLLRRHRIQPRHLVYLGRIDTLQRLDAIDGEIVVGGAVTHRTIERSPIFAGALVALREACETVGSVQTRNVGTLGGNLCNASPAADTPPVLLAFGASVDVAGPGGVRHLPLQDFFLDYRTTALGPNELLTAVRVPVPTGRTGSAFEKLGRRWAMEISIVCVGVRVALDGDGRSCADVGIGLGSVAATPIRASAAEAVLRGHEATDARLAEAAVAAAATTQPIDDLRGSAAYRRDVTATLVHRALERAVVRARASEGAQA